MRTDKTKKLDQRGIPPQTDAPEVLGDGARDSPGDDTLATPGDDAPAVPCDASAAATHDYALQYPVPGDDSPMALKGRQAIML